MSDIEKVQMFEDQKVRTIWIESEEKWYFSIKDVISVLADAKNPKDYLSKMRCREPEFAKGWGQIVHPLVVRTPGGPQKENFANLEGMFRIIQSIPSKRAEPFKRWLAQARGIRANAIAPGYVLTEMTEVLPQAVKDEFIRLIPMKRGATVEEIANTALYLGSDLSSYVSGQVIAVNGGMYC